MNSESSNEFWRQIGTCTALHGTGTASKIGTIAECIQVCVDWLPEEYRDSVLLKGEKGRSIQHKNVSNKDLLKRLTQRNLTFTYVPVETANRPYKVWSFNLFIDPSSFTTVLAANLQQLNRSTLEYLDLAQSVCKLLEPTYAYRYEEKMRFVPLMFGVGVNAQIGISNIEESIQPYGKIRQTWGFKLPSSPYRMGFLRDVYTHNYLTHYQLDAPVNGVPLREWIVADEEQRGTLTDVTDQVKLWKPPADHIAAIREELDAAWRIFPYRNFT